MRVSTTQLQQLTIFTTVLTGAGIGTMYYLLQKKFVESDYHRLALQKLEACPVAMESLGAPPLKVHNIHLTDRNNRIDQHTAQVHRCLVSHQNDVGDAVSCACLFGNLVLVIVLNFQVGSLLHRNTGHDVWTK
ncbi:uncharacterized protein coa1 isoform X1 [Anarrhichthys ocellatus]|uniref:uncharacterized protein coa1 isoform X1 n=1 Tax=Anarrhichthys ocellatus TaxID=433405 RepID=UPI0012ED5EFB|nr:uncharacterized protein LOC116399790 isoform X1 [Anarrhichthys ocellatus]